jgi:hypothetical protein
MSAEKLKWEGKEEEKQQKALRAKRPYRDPPSKSGYDGFAHGFSDWMPLREDQDTSTNWSAGEWKAIERLTKVLADSDDKSGRPWTVGDIVTELVPAGDDTTNTGSHARLRDLGLEVGAEASSLREYRRVAMAWPHAKRVASVGWTVHRVLAASPDRQKILGQLVKDHERFGWPITESIARKTLGLKRKQASDLDKVKQARRLIQSLQGPVDPHLEAALGQLILLAQVILDQGPVLRRVK